MKTTEVAGLKLVADSRTAVIESIKSRLDLNQPTKIFTSYSEFLVRAIQDKSFFAELNSADINLPDGVGVIWAANFLDTKRKFENQTLEFFRLLIRVAVTGAQIVFRSKSFFNIIPEKISGSNFVYDLCELAEQKQLSVFMLGGVGETGQQAGQALLKKYPKLNIVGYCNFEMNNDKIDIAINQVSPKLLLVAFKPQAQEIWINKHLPQLPSVRVAIGLGGTFDYLAGHYPIAPNVVSKLGLEWLFRLLTQPSRYKRIYRGTVGLVLAIIKYKLHTLDEKP